MGAGSIDVVCGTAKAKLFVCGYYTKKESTLT